MRIPEKKTQNRSNFPACLSVSSSIVATNVDNCKNAKLPNFIYLAVEMPLRFSK